MKQSNFVFYGLWALGSALVAAFWSFVLTWAHLRLQKNSK